MSSWKHMFPRSFPFLETEYDSLRNCTIVSAVQCYISMYLVFSVLEH